MGQGWKRVAYVLVFGSLIGIASEQRSCAAPALYLPAAAGGWSIAGTKDCAGVRSARYQMWRGTGGARQVCRADYDGTPRIALTVFDMPERPGATAFDAFQKARVEPGKLAFFDGRFFGVAESRGADMKTLNRFVTAIRARLRQ